MPYVTVEVEVDLDDFDTDDLIDEVNSRKFRITGKIDVEASSQELIHDIYMAKHVRQQHYAHLVDQLIYQALGKVV